MTKTDWIVLSIVILFITSSFILDALFSFIDEKIEKKQGVKK